MAETNNEAIIQLGAIELRRRLNSGRARLGDARNMIRNPLASFNADDQAIIQGATPSYSIYERQLDADYEKYRCPLTQEFPPAESILKWNGNYYDKDALDAYRASAERPLDPLTRELLPLHTFNDGHLPLTTVEKETYEVQGAAYEMRTNRREARQRYDSLLSRYQQLLRSRTAQANNRADNLPVGQAESVEEQVAASLRDNRLDLRFLGTDIQIQQMLDARNNAQANQQANPPANPPANPQANRRSGNSQNQQASIQANPLDELTTTRPVLPGEMWGDQVIEEDFRQLMRQFRIEGYENNIGVRRVAFFDNNAASFFVQGAALAR